LTHRPSWQPWAESGHSRIATNARVSDLGATVISHAAPAT
jgi:hypothetical protein